MLPINILIADDHELIRKGIKAYFDDEPDINVIHTASDGKTAYQFVKNFPEINVVLMDIKMPEWDGIKATKMITDEFPECKIIALTSSAKESNILSIIQAGASGYLLKNASKLEISKAIKLVQNNRIYFSEEISSDFVFNKLMRKKSKKSNSKLSNREIEILNLTSEGNTSHEIGEILSISPRTVDAHKRNLLKKTATKNIAHLIRYAFKNGILGI